MCKLDDLALAKALNIVITIKKWRMTTLAERIDIPYRSLQNYLYGRSRIPATVYLRICATLDIDNRLIAEIAGLEEGGLKDILPAKAPVHTRVVKKRAKPEAA